MDILPIMFQRTKIAGISALFAFGRMNPFITSDSESSDSNHGMTLKEAKSNFLQFGACEKEMLCHVRPPRNDEKKMS